MNRLEEEFNTSVDFLHLDVDLAETRQIMADFGVRNRSSYLLVTGDGTLIQGWYGPLPNDIEAQFAAALESVQP